MSDGLVTSAVEGKKNAGMRFVHHAIRRSQIKPAYAHPCIVPYIHTLVIAGNSLQFFSIFGSFTELQFQCTVKNQKNDDEGQITMKMEGKVT